MSKNEHSRDMDKYLKKIVTVTATFLLVTISGGIVQFIQMSSALATMEKRLDKTETITLTDNTTVTEIRIRQEVIKEDINEIKNEVKGNRSLILQILREVKK